MQSRLEIRSVDRATERRYAGQVLRTVNNLQREMSLNILQHFVQSGILISLFEGTPRKSAQNDENKEKKPIMSAHLTVL